MIMNHTLISAKRNQCEIIKMKRVVRKMIKEAEFFEQIMIRNSKTKSS